MEKQFIQEISDNLRKAVCWISETVQQNPEKNRDTILREAEIRFDLSPRECEFLSQNFNKLPTT